MTATPTAFSLGKYHNLFVGSAADSSTDSAFTKVVNENSITATYKADNDKVSTKEAGQITIPNGDESYEIKGQADIVFADAALATLINSKNQSWPFQIRDVTPGATAVEVILEGNFIVNQLEFKFDDKGVQSVSFTMENSGAVTYNYGGRTVTGS